MMKMMKMNIGIIDAIIRLLIGWVLTHLGIFVKISPTLNWILIIIGTVLVLTAVTRRCGVYNLLKISTYKGS